jgi:DNA-binding Lrp family transcriptional regulator
MGVWVVPETLVQNVGEKMAEFKEVSHCYERVALPDWPYNLYTMVHEKSPQECEQVMQRISQAINIAQYSLLFSQAELKKSSMRYFLEDASQEHVI